MNEQGFIVKSVAYSVPTNSGVELIILILYLISDMALAGRVAAIVPETVDARDPIFTGFVKLPEVSLNCAVKVFVVPKLPVAEKGIFIAAPEQIGEAIFDAAILAPEVTVLPVRLPEAS